MRKILAFMLIALYIIFPSCGKKEKEKCNTTLHLNLVNDPSSFHPQKIRNLQSIFVARHLFDGLMRIGLDNKPHEAAAESYTISEDGKIYTFKLREAFWSHHEKVKASDFVYAWRKALDPSFPCDYVSHFYVIKNAEKIKQGFINPEMLGVQAIDEFTLAVELNEPTPYFLELLTFPVYYPICESEDKKNPQRTNEVTTLFSNGPYLLKNWIQGDSITLEKNLTYWNASSVHLEKIDLCMVATGTEMQLYEKGEIDWMGSPISLIPLESIPTFAKNGVLKKSPYLGTYYLRFNTLKKELSNPNIRKALALAINKRKITELGLSGSQNDASSFVPQHLYFNTEEEAQYQNDVAKANELLTLGLKEEGLSLKDITFNFAYLRNDERNKVITEIIQEEWQKNLKIKINLNAIESKFYFSSLAEKKFDIATGSWIADFPDAVNFLEVFSSKDNKTNVTGWENNEFASLLVNAKAEKDIQKRSNFLKAAEKMLLNETPIIPIFHYNMLYLKNEKLKNVILNDTGAWDFSQAYFKETKEE